MEHIIKKNIRIVAEKYNHIIKYDKDALLLSSDINQISVSSKDKYSTVVEYNTEDGVEKLEVSKAELYDVVIELLRRREKETISLKEGKLLDLETYIEDEGDFVKEVLEKLKQEILENKVASKELPGNRILAEYYNGIIILDDDLRYYRSNVIEFT